MDRTSPERERNKAVTILIMLFFLALLAAAFLAYSKFGYDEGWLTKKEATALSGGAMVIILASTLGIAFAQDNYRSMRDPEPPEEPPEEIVDMLEFSAEHEPADSRLIAPGDNPNQLLTCRYKFNTNQWLRLTQALHRNNWIFSRDNSVKEADVFKHSITPGTALTRDWSEITREFNKLRVIQKRGSSWYVTEAGKVMLCDMAKLDVVI